MSSCLVPFVFWFFFYGQKEGRGTALYNICFTYMKKSTENQMTVCKPVHCFYREIKFFLSGPSDLCFYCYKHTDKKVMALGSGANIPWACANIKHRCIQS